MPSSSDEDQLDQSHCDESKEKETSEQQDKKEMNKDEMDSEEEKAGHIVQDRNEEEKFKNEEVRKSIEGKEEEEEDEEEEEEEQTKMGLLDRPVEVSGCRDRKKVQRLEIGFTVPTKENPEVPEGTGEKLGDCPRIEFEIQKKNNMDDLKLLHRILFAKAGSVAQLKKRIRKFNGFPFEKNSVEYSRKKSALDKVTNANLKNICKILDVERSGVKEDIVLRILDFLMQPKASGKNPPMKKVQAKSVKKRPGAKNPGSKKSSEKDKSSSSDDEHIDSEIDHNTDEAESKGNEEPAKKKKKITKKLPPSDVAKKRKRSVSKQSKKVKGEASSDEHSTSDENPGKVKKIPPTNEELKALIQKILKAADLEEITMKKVVLKVYDHFPDFDLSSRKDFIKDTVKSVIS